MVSDPFSDGNRNGGADPLGLAWWRISPSAGGQPVQLSIVSDAGLGSGLALRVDNAGTNANLWSNKGFMARFPTQTLVRTGDRLTLSFAFRFAQIFASDPLNLFSFGLYDSRGTLVTADHQYSLSIDDRGYLANFTYGTSPGAAFFAKEPGGAGAILSEDLAQLGPTAISGVSLGVSAVKRTAVFSVEKTASGVSLQMRILDDRDLPIFEASQNDAAAVLTAFDEIVIATRRMETDYLIDNVKVDFTPAGTAPPPATPPPVTPPPALPPTTQPDTVTMHRGQKAAIAVLGNDTGNIATATVTIVQPPQFGTAVPNGTGRVLYTHTSGTPTTDTFSYRVSGSGGPSAPASVAINFATGLRVASHALNVPAAPPATAYQLTPAFGALTFDQPVCLRTPPGETKRLFVCEKSGLLRMIPDVTAANPTVTTFLNLPTDVTAPRGEVFHGGGECGLLSVAFHPAHASNRQFFVFYSVFKAGVLYQRISRFLTAAGNPHAADPASEKVLIEQRDDASNHNAGDLHFGADGYLYVSLGDEGRQDDFYNNAQRIDRDFHAAMLRLDVDRKPGSLEPNPHPNPTPLTGSEPAVTAIPRYETAPGSGVFVAAYAIPPNNPLIGATSFNGQAVSPAYVRTEMWATGLRNPWRFSIDPATGKVWCGDVGGNLREEVNIITAGGNYGWAYREASIDGPKSTAAPGNFNTAHAPPLYEYPHGSGSKEGGSVVGGYVYRGSRLPALLGRYVFGDHVSGNIWSIQQDGTGVQRLAGEGGIAAFGPDPSNGDVLVADFDGHRVLRLVAGGTSDFPQTLSATGLFADLTDLAPNPGLLPYEVNLPFWSDHAQKRRWLMIPNATDRMTWSRDGVWTFPAGQIWVKHFDLPLKRSTPPRLDDPQTPTKRIETRLLVKTAAGAYGVSYRWNDAGTEAVLAPDEGANFDIPLTQNGAPHTQHWRIPSRAECLTCHTPEAGYVLSATTRQLNLANVIHGFAGSQLDLLRAAGYFSNAPEPASVLPRHLRPDETASPVEARVRSYLAVNCANCHRGGSTGTATWDARPEILLEQTGLLHGVAANSGTDPANRLVVPGDPLHSILHSRIAATGGFTRMPAIASTELDQTNIALLAEWIGSSDLVNRARATPFFIGTYTKTGKSQGVYVSRLDSETGKLGAVELAGEAANPSFVGLSPDGKFLYAALESGAGAVAAYAVGAGGKLTKLNEQPTGGGDTCHVWVDATGRNVLVANYTGGSIACFRTNPDGSLGVRSAFVQFAGSGPNLPRQQQPHGHAVYTDPTNRFVYACDLGTDHVWTFGFDAATGTLTPATPPAGTVPPGSGPRHLAFHPGGGSAYAANELGLSITAFARDTTTGALTALQTVPTLPAGTPTAGVSTAEIFCHPTGRWLYVSNRGHDTITVYAIGADGRLTWIENAPAQVKVPRGFAIDPSGKWLLTAGQNDDRIVVLRIDQTTGQLTPTGQSAEVGSPVSIFFQPAAR